MAVVGSPWPKPSSMPQRRAKRRGVTILSQHSIQTLLKLKDCLCCLRCLPADNTDVADELSLTPSVYAASDGERKAIDALQAGAHSALHAGLMLVRTDAIVCVPPPPVGSLAWPYSVEVQGSV